MTSDTENRTTSRPPRRRGLPTLVLVALVSATLASGATWLALRPGTTEHTHGEKTAAASYQCPMHPNIVQDHPGDCPVCGMKLVKVEAAEAPKATAPATRFQCPMHPNIVQDHPGDCPVCGMKLVKVEAGKAGGHDQHGSALPGLATVDIDPARQQLIGLRTTPATRGAISASWRTSGKVTVDETRVRRINIKVPGYVERVYVNFTGRRVRKGEPLFAMYSPELLSAQEEYLIALRSRKALAGGALKGDGDELLQAARRRLALWDVPAAAIARLERTGEPMRLLTLTAPVSGVVVKKDVVEGTKLDAGAMPYEIVDLSSVWVLADVYESELPKVKIGMPAKLTLKAIPGREFEGNVLFIDPVLDAKTRTAKLRLAFRNPTGELRPEMYGEVVLRSRARDGLRVPDDAIVDSGTEKIVFVALGQGRFQPRVVKLGETSGDHVEVVSGLKEGEQVVTRANFLIDSESRLRAALAELAAAARPKAPDSARVLPEPSTAPQPASDGLVATGAPPWGGGNHAPAHQHQRADP